MVEILDLLRALPHLSNPWSGEQFDKTDYFSAKNGYPFYVRAAEIIRPQRILEIGSHFGFGLISFAAGFSDCEEIVSIDNESYVPQSRKFCLENFEAAWLRMAELDDRISVENRPSISMYAHYAELMRRNRCAMPGFDLIHIDGDHSYEGAIADMLFGWSLKPRVMLVDDYYYIDSTRVAVERGRVIIIFPSRYGIRFGAGLFSPRTKLNSPPFPTIWFDASVFI